MKTFNELFTSQQTEADILCTVSKAEEFEQLKVRGQVKHQDLNSLHSICNMNMYHCIDLGSQVREEEMEELEQLLCNYCELPAAGGVENSYGKVNILLQTYIGRGEVDSFSLMSDLSYVAQVGKQNIHPGRISLCTRLFNLGLKMMTVSPLCS